METQTTTPKKQKANLDLKIELPNSEKPFFNKMSTENNMLSQVKKASTKLGENEKLYVSINGTTIPLSKAEIQSVTLGSDIQEKLKPEREINKGRIDEGGSAEQKMNKVDTNHKPPGHVKIDMPVDMPDVIMGARLTDRNKQSLLDGVPIQIDVPNSPAYHSYELRIGVDNKLTLTEYQLALKEDKLGEKTLETISKTTSDLLYDNVSYDKDKGNNQNLSKEVGNIAVDRITLEDLKRTDQNPDVILGKTLVSNDKTYVVYDVRVNPDNDHKYYLREANVPHTMDTEATLYKSMIESNLSNPNQLSPLLKNLNYLKDQIKFLGFGEDANLHHDLTHKMLVHDKEFTISIGSKKTSFQNKASFDLQFNRTSETTNFFFNKFVARLTNEKRNVDLQHTFAVKNNGFTAKQAINLLEGRSVKTEITNPNTKEKETAFVKLKLNEEKNENGNFKLQVYNKNYGVDTAKIVEKSNLLFKDEKHKEITIKSLEKGNIVAVNMKEKDKVIEGKAVLSPQYKTLNLYDNNMKRLNSNAPVLEETAKMSENVKKQQHQSR